MRNNTNDENDIDGINWKWWHFLVASPLIVAVAVWQFTEGKIGRAIGGLALALLCVVLGFGIKPKH